MQSIHRSPDPSLRLTVNVRTATNSDVEWIDARADEARRPRVTSGTARWLTTAGVVVVLVLVVAFGTNHDSPGAGTQLPSPAVAIASAEGRQWRRLPALDGSTREGWPHPMIAAGAEICFGFENDAIRPPRPSLARCIDRGDVGELDEQRLVSLVTVRSGRDVWHVLWMSAPPVAFDLRTVDGSPIDEGRIHIDGAFVALRLAETEPVGELTWRVGRTTTRCVPAIDLNDTGRFCPPAP